APEEAAEGFVIRHAKVIADGGGVEEPEDEPVVVGFVPGDETFDETDRTGGENRCDGLKSSTHQIAKDVPEELRESKLLGGLNDRDTNKGKQGIDDNKAEP